MPRAQGEPQTFVEMVRVLLEDRFPWLGKDEEEVSGADAVQDLSDLHEELVHRCDSMQPPS
jgi:hypothetical protein